MVHHPGNMPPAGDPSQQPWLGSHGAPPYYNTTPYYNTQATPPQTDLGWSPAGAQVSSSSSSSYGNIGGLSDKEFTKAMKAHARSQRLWVEYDRLELLAKRPAFVVEHLLGIGASRIYDTTFLMDPRGSDQIGPSAESFTTAFDVKQHPLATTDHRLPRSKPGEAWKWSAVKDMLIHASEKSHGDTAPIKLAILSGLAPKVVSDYILTTIIEDIYLDDNTINFGSDFLAWKLVEPSNASCWLEFNRFIRRCAQLYADVEHRMSDWDKSERPLECEPIFMLNTWLQLVLKSGYQPFGELLDAESKLYNKLCAKETVLPWTLRRQLFEQILRGYPRWVGQANIGTTADSYASVVRDLIRRVQSPIELLSELSAHAKSIGFDSIDAYLGKWPGDHKRNIDWGVGGPSPKRPRTDVGVGTESQTTDTLRVRLLASQQHLTAPGSVPAVRERPSETQVIRAPPNHQDRQRISDQYKLPTKLVKERYASGACTICGLKNHHSGQCRNKEKVLSGTWKPNDVTPSKA